MANKLVLHNVCCCVVVSVLLLNNKEPLFRTLLAKTKKDKYKSCITGRCLTYSGVEAQVTDVTGDDGFLLGWRHAEGVVDHRLLHRIHLHVMKTGFN